MSRNRVYKQMKKAQQAGLSNVDLLRIRELAKKHAADMETQATEKAFLYMLAIPLNVVVDRYIKEGDKTEAEKFIEDVISLYDSVMAGKVTDKELADFLEDMVGLQVTAKWLVERCSVSVHEECEVGNGRN